MQMQWVFVFERRFCSFSLLMCNSYTKIAAYIIIQLTKILELTFYYSNLVQFIVISHRIFLIHWFQINIEIWYKILSIIVIIHFFLYSLLFHFVFLYYMFIILYSLCVVGVFIMLICRTISSIAHISYSNESVRFLPTIWNKSKMEISDLYKKMFICRVVFGPPWWAMF